MKENIFKTAYDTYKTISVAGNGGGGQVFSVTNTTAENFALKLASASLNTEQRKRFKNEIEFCRKSNHPNIVHIIDVGLFIDEKERERPFYVMQLFHSSLRERIKDINNDKLRLEIFVKILDGVEAAHLQDVWHRDIKPENILCSEDFGELVIADFGIAHFEEPQLHTEVKTKASSRMANYHYAAPEQKEKGAKVDSRCDIYALGLILNELFTAEVPQGEGFKKIAEVSENYAYLDDLVAVMRQQNPAKRPQNIREIKEELIRKNNLFVALQELDSVKNTIIKDTGPVEFEDVCLVEFDYDNRSLVLGLNRPVEQAWIHGFQNPSSFSSISGFGPKAFHFQGTKAFIQIPANHPFMQTVVDHFKSYLVMANHKFVSLLQHEKEQARKEKQKLLAAQRTEAKQRIDVLQNIKI